MRKLIGLAVVCALLSGAAHAQQLEAVLGKAQAFEDKMRECGPAAGPAKERVAACTAAYDMTFDRELVFFFELGRSLGPSARSPAREPTLTIEVLRAATLGARSEAKLDASDYDGAIADLDNADKLLPRDARILNARCWTRAVAKRDLDAARGYCKAAIEIQRDANIFDSLGLVNLQQRRWQDAWDAYNEAISIEPSLTASLYGRGLAALALGRAPEGEADIAKASAAAAEFAGYGLTPESVRAN